MNRKGDDGAYRQSAQQETKDAPPSNAGLRQAPPLANCSNVFAHMQEPNPPDELAVPAVVRGDLALAYELAGRRPLLIRFAH